jgi:hypothetical protein
MDAGAMKTTPRISGRKEPYGPNIVRAWFDTVFQYALRGLESERSFLTRRNWTFRFHTRTLEYLGPLVEYLPAGARENLEQFVSFFPKVGEKISEHDICEHQLEESCRAYFAAILDNGDFRKTFESIASEAPQALGREFSSHFGAYSSDADFMGILAEYLINNVETLPSYYSTAELWNRYRDRFPPLVSEPALASFREATEREGRAVLQAVDGLTSLLKETRSALSLRFDVPYVAELNSVR